jgi:pimeloyl-ACP methyl ester carboxylesterase
MREYYLIGKPSICYRKNNFRARKTLVFIHGLSGSSSAWDKYEKFFSNDYNILTFDLRGHGRSDKPSRFEDYELNKLAGDLYSLLKHEKIRKLVLISHSFGNLIALEFLKKHGEMVQKVVFLSAAHNPGRRLAAKVIKPFLTIYSHLNFNPIKKKGSHVDYSKYMMTGDWNIPRMIADIRNTTLRIYLYGTLQSYYVNSYDFLPKIKQQTLIIHGAKDTIFPLNHAQEMSRAIKNCKMIVLGKADHILVLNYFEIISKHMKKFINA